MKYLELIMDRVPSGVTEVEYKRAFARLEHQSSRRPTQRAEAKSQSTNLDAAALQLDMSRRFNLGSVGPSKWRKLVMSKGAADANSTLKSQRQTRRGKGLAVSSGTSTCARWSRCDLHELFCFKSTRDHG